MGAFFDTLIMFKKYIGKIEPLTYEQWLTLSDSHKIASLYVHFYDVIIKAYQANCSKYATEEECVSRLLQYLNRNVSHITNDPERFNSAYIYTVSANSISTLTHSSRVSKNLKFYYDNVVSNNAYNSEGLPVDLYDTISDDTRDIWSNLLASKIPKLEEQLTPQEYRVAEYIMFERRLPKRIMRRYNALLSSIQDKFQKLLE